MHKLLTANTAKYYEPTYLKISRVKNEIKIESSLEHDWKNDFYSGSFFHLRAASQVKVKNSSDENFKL